MPRQLRRTDKTYGKTSCFPLDYQTQQIQCSLIFSSRSLSRNYFQIIATAIKHKKFLRGQKNVFVDYFGDCSGVQKVQQIMMTSLDFGVYILENENKPSRFLFLVDNGSPVIHGWTRLYNKHRT